MTGRYGMFRLECNWADEIDIKSFELAKETDFLMWSFMKENYPEFFETPFNFYIGSNQGFDVDMDNGFYYSWITLEEIPKVAYDIIRDIVGTSNGKFPEMVDDMYCYMDEEFGVSFGEHADHWIETGEVLPVDRDYKANKLREKLARLEDEREKLKEKGEDYLLGSDEHWRNNSQLRRNYYEIKRVKKQLGE